MRKLFLGAALLLQAATQTRAQYITTWVGNTYGDNTNHVGNCARSMWVSPGGIVYAASQWDENGHTIGIYQNGATLGSLAGNSSSQGSAIGGDSTYIFVAMTTPNAGKIGRYIRATKVRDLLFQASTSTVSTLRTDVIKGIAVLYGSVYVSDSVGNRIAVFSAGGTLLRQWAVTAPGAIAVDSSGNLWVAQQSTATLRSFDSNGTAGPVIQMSASSRPSALYIDNSLGQLYVGDQGPDMNIKIYCNLSGTPALAGTFGIQGGYLDQGSGIRGQTGDKRFTRIAGIGRDQWRNLYVLNNPWGGTWDLGRNGATDIHCYDSTGTFKWTLQALNFEGCAAADAGTDGMFLYSGNNIYSYNGIDGGSYVANTVDPYRYPWDARIQMNDHGRGEHFGHLAYNNGHRILVANNQNADVFYTYYFNPSTDGYIAIPWDTISKVRNGFCLDSLGDIWISQDKTFAIQHYPITGFAANGKPIRGPIISTPVPNSIRPLNRLEYLPGSDVMILAGTDSNWILIGNRIEVYNGWKAGNRTPNTVITLSRAVAKSMSAAGSYLFVGYYAIPNIDVFDLTTGSLVLTLVSNNSVYVGNDVDSEYGVKAFKKSNGEYLIMKDDYNAAKIVLYRWTPGLASAAVTLSKAGGKADLKPGDASLSVYPNPVDGLLHVALKNAPAAWTLTIADLSGKVVKTVRKNTSDEALIGMADLPAGAYMLSVTDVGTGRLIATHTLLKK